VTKRALLSVSGALGRWRRFYAHLPAAAAPHDPENNEKQDRAYGRLNDCRHHSDAQVNPQARQQPTPDEGTHNSNTYIRDEAMSCTANEMTAKPPRNQADKQDNKDTFVRHGPLPNG
jgi:hypothetical protein